MEVIMKEVRNGSLDEEKICSLEHYFSSYRRFEKIAFEKDERTIPRFNK